MTARARAASRRTSGSSTQASGSTAAAAAAPAGTAAAVQPSTPAPAPPPSGDATTTTYREAMREAIRAAMLADERVFLMGEDVGAYGGCFGVSTGLLEQFGPERVRDTPLSESAFVGAGVGAALGGMRPIVEIMTVNFSLLALDQIMNTARRCSTCPAGSSTCRSSSG